MERMKAVKRLFQLSGWKMAVPEQWWETEESGRMNCKGEVETPQKEGTAVTQRFLSWVTGGIVQILTKLQDNKKKALSKGKELEGLI